MLTRKRQGLAVLLAMVVGFGLLVSFWSDGVAAGLQGAFPVRSLPTAEESAYTLSFYNTHSHEKADITYRRNGQYDRVAMDKIKHMLRDRRNGKMHEIDGELMDLLATMQVSLRARHPEVPIVFHIISGYRSPESNESMRKAGGGQGKKSLHMDGKAIDIRIPGIPSTTIRDVAWCLQKGGVGYYKGSDFVHVDTGTVRHWNWKPTAQTCGSDRTS